MGETREPTAQDKNSGIKKNLLEARIGYDYAGDYEYESEEIDPDKHYQSYDSIDKPDKPAEGYDYALENASPLKNVETLEPQEGKPNGDQTLNAVVDDKEEISELNDENAESMQNVGKDSENSILTTESKNVDEIVESYDEKVVSISNDENVTEGSTSESETKLSYDEDVTKDLTSESYDENTEPKIEGKINTESLTSTIEPEIVDKSYNEKANVKDNLGSTSAGDVTETSGADGKLLIAPGDVNGEPMNEDNEAATIEDQPDVTEGSTNGSETEKSYSEGVTKGFTNESHDEEHELIIDDEIEIRSTIGPETLESYDENVTKGSTGDSEEVESYDENAEQLIEDKKGNEGSTYAGDVTETTGADEKLLMAPGDVNGEPMNEETEAATIEDQPDVTEGSTNESQTEQSYYEGSTNESYDENSEPVTEDGINEGSISTKGSEDVDKSYDEKAELKIDDEIESEGLTKGSKMEELYDGGITEGPTGDSETMEQYDENAEPTIEDEEGVVGSTYAGDVTETTGADGKLLMAPGDVNGEPMNEETEAATIEDHSDVTEGSTNESQTEESYYEGSTSESYDENTEPLIKDEIGSTCADGKLLMAPGESYYEGSTSESYDENPEPITK